MNYLLLYNLFKFSRPDEKRKQKLARLQFVHLWPDEVQRQKRLKWDAAMISRDIAGGGTPLAAADMWG